MLYCMTSPVSENVVARNYESCGMEEPGHVPLHIVSRDKGMA